MTMESLVDAYEKIAADEEVEMYKLAEEEAAGRIMARGFMDELQKVAQGSMFGPKTETPIARQSYGSPAPAAKATGPTVVHKRQSPMTVASNRSVPSQAQKPYSPPASGGAAPGSLSSLSSMLRPGGGMAAGKKTRPTMGSASVGKKSPSFK
jgi:hypothetical protein